MSKTITKLGKIITIASSANEKDNAKAVAKAVAKVRGDNAKVSATQLESCILRASASYEDLIDAVRNCAHDQKEVQTRAFLARWYAMDYMDAVKAGKVKESRDQSGNVMIPAMTEKDRKHYAALIKGAEPEAKSLKEGQVRCTAEQWKRKATLRQWWKRLLGAAGVLTVETRGGARVITGKAKVAKGAHDGALKTGNKPEKAPAINKATGEVPFAAPAIVRVDTPKAAAAFYYAQAKAIYNFTQLNRKPFKKGAEAPAARFEKLVNTFFEQVTKLAHELDKAKATM